MTDRIVAQHRKRKPRKQIGFERKVLFHCEACERVIRYSGYQPVMRYDPVTSTIRTPSGLTIKLRKAE